VISDFSYILWGIDKKYFFTSGFLTAQKYNFSISNFYEFNEGSHVDSYSGGSNEHLLVTLPL